VNDPQSATKATMRQRTFLLLRADNPTRVAIWTRSLIAIAIVLNVIAVVLESYDAFHSVHRVALEGFEIVSVLLFTVEYGLRVWASAEDPQFEGANPWRGRWSYIRSGMGIVDLVAIAPFYLGFIVTLDLRQLRAFRLLRLLKLSRSFGSLNIFSHVFRSQIPNLIAATLVILILLILSSSLMYSVESDAGQFDDIAEAMWWSVVTLTTVGYGDVIPSTPLGKLLGGFIMLLGIGLVALPAAILGGKFADELVYRRMKVTTQAADFLKDGELSENEQKELERRGHQEGFSNEEIEEIKSSVIESGAGSSVCPNCGHAMDDV
jgi:voltage-gated potassium channel